MRAKHRPQDASATDPEAPHWLTTTVENALGRPVTLRTHPWQVLRRIHIGSGIVVREAPDTAETRARSTHEMECAKTLGPQIAQQPLLAEAIRTRGKILTIWQLLPGNVGQNTAEEARELAHLLRALHQHPSPNTNAPHPLAHVAALLDHTRTARDAATRHYHQALDILRTLQPATERTFIHGDPHGGNAIFHAETATLIDFENSGTGDPHWDIAVLSRAARGALGPRARTSILEWYGRELDTDRVRLLEYVRGASTLPVKLTAEGLRGIDFTPDIEGLVREYEALSG